MSEQAAMLEEVLIPAGTVLHDKGDSRVVEISGANARVFLLELKISEVVEQEYLELSLLGSEDGTTWGARPLATLPQRFYPGEYSTLLDLSAVPAIRFLKFHWELNRWGRGSLTPHFICGLSLREVPAENAQGCKSKAVSA